MTSRSTARQSARRAWRGSSRSITRCTRARSRSRASRVAAAVQGPGRRTRPPCGSGDSCAGRRGSRRSRRDCHHCSSARRRPDAPSSANTSRSLALRPSSRPSSPRGARAFPSCPVSTPSNFTVQRSRVSRRSARGSARLAAGCAVRGPFGSGLAAGGRRATRRRSLRAARSSAGRNASTASPSSATRTESLRISSPAGIPSSASTFRIAALEERLERVPGFPGLFAGGPDPGLHRVLCRPQCVADHGARLAHRAPGTALLPGCSHLRLLAALAAPACGLLSPIGAPSPRLSSRGRPALAGREHPHRHGQQQRLELRRELRDDPPRVLDDGHGPRSGRSKPCPRNSGC